MEFEECKVAEGEIYGRLIREMCYIDDIVAHRGRLEAEEQQHRIEEDERRRREEEIRRAAEEQRLKEEAELARIRSEQQREAQRRFAERAATEKRNISLRQRDLSDEDIRRLADDLCLACGHRIKIRRNNRFGHLFFGCSQWSPVEDECLCSGARPATCNICRDEMHEESNRPGVNVLRCENYPDCPGERTIPENLEISRWLKSRKFSTTEIRAHFADLGLIGE